MQPVRQLLDLCRIPSRCWACQSWAHSCFCDACRIQLAPWGESPARCTRCALRVPWGIDTCISCQRNPPPQCYTIACLDYDAPWVEWIQRFKFHGRPELAPAWANLMVKNLALPSANGYINSLPDHAWLLPIPISPERLRARGYNQAWELAKHCAKRLGRKAKADVLQRVIDIPQQVGMTRAQRLQRLQGVFEINPIYLSAIQGQVIVLIDDVYTTGATTSEAANTLLNAGASSVIVWALARTPAPDDEAS
jgi:ComF family protein